MRLSKKQWSYRNREVLDRKALRGYKALNLTKPKGTHCSENVMIVNYAHYRVSPSRKVLKGRVVVLYRRDQARSDRSTVTTRLHFARNILWSFNRLFRWIALGSSLERFGPACAIVKREVFVKRQIKCLLARLHSLVPPPHLAALIEGFVIF